MFEIYTRVKKCCKKLRKVSCFWDNCIWIGIVKLSLLTTQYFPWAGNVLTSSTKILRVNKRPFATQLTWQWSKKMKKVLWRRFQKFLGTFTILLFEGSSGTRLLRHLYDYVFGDGNIGNTKSMRVIFFFNIFII